MLRMRLSIDCGYAAVATQGGSDNLFTVVSLATLNAVGRAVKSPETTTIESVKNTATLTMALN
jgi:hypothetical protein